MYLRKIMHQFLLSKTIGTLLLGFLCLISVGSTLRAATISIVDQSSISCKVKVTGVILEGDAERLIKQIKKAKGEKDYGGSFDLNSYDFRVCFNSPGGSYLEGIKIARLIDVPTGVDEGDICESACFLAFMSGLNTFFMENDSGAVWQDRVMHPLAKVGYHAPALDIEAGNFTEKQVTRAYNIALFSVAELIQLRKEKHESYIFRDYLFEDMLKVSSDQMKYIQTVDQAVKAQIVVFPTVLPGAMGSPSLSSQYPQDKNYGGIAHACRALGLMSNDFDVSSGPDQPKVVTRSESVQFSAIFDGGESGTLCKLTLGLASDPAWQIGQGTASDYWIPENSARLASYMFYPPSTEIDTLKHPFNYEELNSNFLSGFSGGGGDGRTFVFCAIKDPTTKIMNVQRFTNLRQKAGLNGQVTAQVPLGATVSVVKPGTFLRYDKCAAACNGTNQNAIKQCIDNNDVWIEVQYNGRRGFLSRKFLE